MTTALKFMVLLHYVVQNILLSNSEIYVVVEKFRNVTDFFKYPVSSGFLGIHSVCDPCGLVEVVPVSEITSKCVLLPYCNKYVSIPLLHWW